MLKEQADARAELANVTASASAKFLELDGLIAQTRSGLEDVAGQSLHLGAQQAALRGQQDAVEQYLRQQQRAAAAAQQQPSPGAPAVGLASASPGAAPGGSAAPLPQPAAGGVQPDPWHAPGGGGGAAPD